MDDIAKTKLAHLFHPRAGKQAKQRQPISRLSPALRWANTINEYRA
ncbi:hypothetical protein BH10PSE14_BH10PSE14_17930 [soil metagenome]